MQHVPQLEGLQNRTVGPYTLQVQCVSRRRVGHFDVDIFLKGNDGKLSCEPIVTGIYSKGHPKGKIFGWLDIHYLDLFGFDNGDAVVLYEIKESSRCQRGGEVGVVQYYFGPDVQT